MPDKEKCIPISELLKILERNYGCEFTVVMPDEIQREIEEVNIPTGELIKRIERKYGCELDKPLNDTLRKKIKKICEQTPAVKIDETGNAIQTNLWEASQVLNGGKTEHYFTKSQIERLLNSSELDEYVHEKVLLNLDDLAQYKEDKKMAESLNKAHLEYLSAFDPEEGRQEGAPNPFIVTQQEVEVKKREIMLEALFLHFFTPVDTALLKSDMETKLVMDSIPDQHTVETYRACKRLENFSNYYRPRKQDGKN